MGYRIKCLIELHSTSRLAAPVIHCTAIGCFSLREIMQISSLEKAIWEFSNNSTHICARLLFDVMRTTNRQCSNNVYLGEKLWIVNGKHPIFMHTYLFGMFCVCVCALDAVATTILFTCTAVCNNSVGLHLSWPQSKRSKKKFEQNHLIIVCSEKKKLLFRRINTPIFSTESFLFCFLAQWLKIESFTHSLTKFKRE